MNDAHIDYDGDSALSFFDAYSLCALLGLIYKIAHRMTRRTPVDTAAHGYTALESTGTHMSPSLGGRSVILQFLSSLLHPMYRIVA